MTCIPSLIAASTRLLSSRGSKTVANRVGGGGGGGCGCVFNLAQHSPPPTRPGLHARFSTCRTCCRWYRSASRWASVCCALADATANAGDDVAADGALEGVGIPALSCCCCCCWIAARAAMRRAMMPLTSADGAVSGNHVTPGSGGRATGGSGGTDSTDGGDDCSCRGFC